jgi:site-specific DNA recombinase
MTKRAAIYARVSRAYREDGEQRVTIEEQLSDCEDHCKAQGYVVVARYVDKDRYRVKGRLVSPSGARKDRPQYRKMLKAAQADEFEVIVAWKEDRLYRGIYAAIPFTEVLDEKAHLSVELAKGTFDRSMLEIKAAIAKLELDNIRDRMIMGRKARLQRGEIPGGCPRYGYERDETNHLAVNEEEARWVRQIFEWYIEGHNNMEIRRRLNASGAPTRRARLWSKATIGNILTFEGYASGSFTTTLDGEEFEIPCPPLITMAVWRQALDQREQNTSYRGRNVKEDYLCRGMVVCPCGWKWAARTCRGTNNAEGKWGYYGCTRRDHKPESVHPQCPGTIGAKGLDEEVWRFVVALCQDPQVLQNVIDEEIARLEAKNRDLEAEAHALQVKLDNLTNERQWVITQARQGRITEDDMTMQLAALEFQSLDLKRQQNETLTALTLKEKAQGLREWVSEYLSDIEKGIEGLDVDSENLTETEAQTLFERLEADRFLDKYDGDRLKALNWALLEKKRRFVQQLISEVQVFKSEEGEKVIVPVLAFEVPIEYASLAYNDQSLEYVEEVGRRKQRTAV